MNHFVVQQSLFSLSDSKADNQYQQKYFFDLVEEPIIGDTLKVYCVEDDFKIQEFYDDSIFSKVSQAGFVREINKCQHLEQAYDILDLYMLNSRKNYVDYGVKPMISEEEEEDLLLLRQKIDQIGREEQMWAQTDPEWWSKALQGFDVDDTVTENMSQISNDDYNQEGFLEIKPPCTIVQDIDDLIELVPFGTCIEEVSSLKRQKREYISIDDRPIQKRQKVIFEDQSTGDLVTPVKEDRKPKAARKSAKYSQKQEIIVIDDDE